MVEFLPAEKLGDDIKLMVEKLRERIWEQELDELKPCWLRMYRSLMDYDNTIRTAGILDLVFLIEVAMKATEGMVCEKPKVTSKSSDNKKVKEPGH